MVAEQPDMDRNEQGGDRPCVEQGSDHSDEDPPDEGDQHREQDADATLGEEERPDTRLVPVAIGPKMEMDGRRGEEQDGTDDDHEADHRPGWPTTRTHGPPGSNFTVKAHAAPTRHSGDYVLGSYLHRDWIVDG